jgi:hypothetical protein
MSAIAIVATVQACQCDEGIIFDPLKPEPYFPAQGKECLAPDSGCVLDFGGVQLNTSSQKSLTIENHGKADLYFKSVEITTRSGRDGVFLEVSSPEVIKYGETDNSGDFVISYSPTALGEDTAVLKIVAYMNKSTDETKEYEVILKGEGVESSIDVCLLNEDGTDMMMCPPSSPECSDADKVAACQSKCGFENGKARQCLVLDFGEFDWKNPDAAPISKKAVVKNLGTLGLKISQAVAMQCPDKNPDGCGLTDMEAGREFLVTDPKGGLINTGLEGGQQNVLTLTYKPYEPGRDKGAFRVLSDDKLVPELNVILKGLSKGAKLCADPATLDFGLVDVGKSKVMPVKLRSCGTEPLDINSATVWNKDSAQVWFDFGSTPPFPKTGMAVGEEISVDLKCQPPKLGIGEGKLNMAVNDPSVKDSIAFVNLVCQSQERACKLKANKSVLDFGKIAGGLSATDVVSLVNLGDDACDVSELKAPTDTAFVITDVKDDKGNPIAWTSAFQVASGSSANVTVRFTAPFKGDPKCRRTDKIQVASNSILAPTITVNLIGEGCVEPFCKFTVGAPYNSQKTINFGDVSPTGLGKTLFLDFKNDGTSDCIIKSARAGNAFVGSAYSYPTQSKTPVTVAPRSTYRIEVKCKPTVAGPQGFMLGWPPVEMPDAQGAVNSLWVDTSDLNQPAKPLPNVYGFSKCDGAGWCYGLTCNGAPSKLDVIPSPLDFGKVTIGCCSQDTIVKLYNNGKQSLKVTNLIAEPSPMFTVVSVKSSSGSSLTVPFDIAGYTSVDVKMKYRPSSKQVNTGKLRIATDAPNASVCEGNPQVCYVEVPLTGEGWDTPHQKDTFDLGAKPKVDVLWCVDNSGSMGDDQNAMVANFPKFISYAIAADIDYHISVVTSEINEAGTSDNGGDPIAPGVFFAKKGYPRIIANVPPSPLTPPFTPAVTGTKVNDAFQANATPGTCCSDEQESCFEAVKMSLTDPLINDPSANQGFLRKYASLAVIMMSDEDEQSDSPVDFYVDFLKSIKGPRNYQLLQVSVIAGLDSNFDPANPTVFPSAQDCDPTSGYPGGERYIDLWKKIYATHKSGLALSICDSNWGNHMSKLGIGVWKAPTEYFLTRPADPSTIRVYLNGSELPNDPLGGYTFDPNNNSIVLGKNVNPPKGSVIVVEYDAQCPAC